VTTITSPYAQAAHRARIIAETARDRFADGSIRMAILTIAAHLDAAADHFAAVPPGTQGLPTEATEELFRAEQAAVDCPATRFPPELGEYVLAPLVDRPLPMPAPLRPLDPAHTLRETDIRNRLVQLHADTAAQFGRPAQWLGSVLRTWQKHMRLADEVRVHNGRPCNQH
jgi:hypothetical protein